jgi:PAS domain S-box-containing protein
MALSSPIDDRPGAGADRETISTESYLRLIDHIPAVVTYVDTERRYQFVSEAMAEWLGGKPEDYVGKHVSEALGEDSYRILSPEIDRVLAGEQVVFERFIPFKTGQHRFVRISYTPDINEEGRVRGYFGLILDISDKHAAEEALQRSEERYRAFIDQSTEGIWRCELRERIPVDLPINKQIELIYEHGYLAECNNAMAAQYGFVSAAEIVGAPLDQLLVKEDPKNYEFLEAFIKSGYSLTEAESHEKDADGNDVYFLNNFVGFIEDGRLVRAWGTQRDITARRKAEAGLARMAAIVQSSDDAIISKDLSGNITSWNKSAERIFGYTSSEIIGKNISLLIPAGRMDEEPRIIERITQGRVVEHYETRRVRKDGVEIDISLTVSPIRNEAGLIIGASKIARDISDQKMSDRTLQESQMLLSMAMQSSRMGAWEHDTATDVVHWNRDLEEIFGLPAGGFEGTRAAFYELIYEEDRQRMWFEVETAVDRHTDYAVEFRFRHADGSIRWMEGRGQAVYSEKGEPVRLYGIGIDITDRKRAEAALSESEERFAKAFNASPLALTISSLVDGTLVEVNDTFVRVSGYSREEALGKTTIELGLWARPDDRTEELNTIREKGQVKNTEYSFRTRDGNEIIGLLSAERIEIGGETFALTVIQDITDRKKAEEALLAAERKAADEYQALLSRIVPLAQTLGKTRDLFPVYRLLLDFVRVSMPCSAFFVSFFDENTSLRTAAYAWGDKGEVDISDLPPIKLTPDGGPNSQAVFQKRSIVATRYMDMMKTRPHVILQEDGIDPNSSLVVPMIVKDRVIGTLEVQAYQDAAFIDEHLIALEMAANLAAVAIENVKLIKSEIDLRNEAEAANRTKDEFLSVLSHELRTPLNSMLGWVRMLRTGALDTERMIKAIEVIERNTRLQIALIEDLLDVSRIISGKMRIEKEPLDLADLARAVVETIRPTALAKEIHFEFEGGSEALFIEGDATRLQQVITNLAENAIKFTPENGMISIAVKRVDSAVELVIKDTGIGIEPEFLPLIFDRFSQADASTRRSYTGLGLGLAIVKKIVDLHQGRITVDSEGPGTGSSFTVSIPLAREFYTAGKPTLLHQPLVEKEPMLHGARILLVDDDAESLIPLRMFLERENAEVVPVHSAQEALAKLTEQDFNVLISDIGMPAMDGYEFISAVRRLSDHQNALVPAIALTAYASADDRKRALSSGFQIHFPKPPDFDELVEAVRELYRRSTP